MTRRQLAASGALASLTAVSLASCDAFSTSPNSARDGRGSGTAHDSQESPSLIQQVRAGRLPSLEDRLPEDPMVVDPLNSIGQFGGTLRRGETNMQSPRNLYFLARVSLAEWDLRDVQPTHALAKSWTISDSGRTYRFVLRKGVRWSDGEPFTADDLEFYGKSILENKELTPVAPTWLRADDAPAKIVKVDDTTVEFRFAEPSSLLLRYLCYAQYGMSVLVPAHYLRRFHPDYRSGEELSELAADAGVKSWTDVFLQKNDMWLNPDRPVLGPWMVTKPSSGSSNRAVLDRNPYYWKVDTKGKQLPYIDRIVINGVDAATATLQAANGNIDLQTTYISVNNMPVLAKNAKLGGYKVLHWGTGSGPYLYTNQCHLDPVMRKLMQDINFRAGLSHSIDRQEMNKLFYGGLGATVQPVCLPQDPYYVQGSGNTFVKHDPDLANSFLDKAGLAHRDEDGFRLRPDGRMLTITISTFPFQTGVESVDAYDLVVGYWKQVGLRAKVDNMDGSLMTERVIASKFDIAGYDMGRYMWDIDPQWYVPVNSRNYWAPLFGIWYESGGQEGERPTGQFKHLQDLYDRLKATIDRQERLALGKEIQTLHDKNVWVIGTVTAPFQPLVVNSDLVNVKKTAVNDYRTGYTQLTWPEQVSYRNPGNN